MTNHQHCLCAPQLLLCVPKEIRIELERRTIDTIHATAQSFAQHAAPVKSSCWLQAKFLSNVLYEFKEANRTRVQPQHTACSSTGGMMRQQDSGLASLKKIRHQSVPNARDPMVDMNAGPSSSLLRHGSGSTNTPLGGDSSGGGISIQHHQQQHRSGSTGVYSEYPQQPHHPFATATTATSTSTPSPAHILGPAPAPPPPGSYSQPPAPSQPTPQDYTFSDDTMWEAMFANAGFNITDGTFLPDAYDYRVQDQDQDLEVGVDEDQGPPHEGDSEGEAGYRHRRRV